MKKLIPLLLLLVAMPSLAQRQFDIEVIIFKRAVEAEKISESWPDSLSEINMARAGNFADANYRQSKGVKMLAYSDYQLNDQVQELKKHAGFDVLLHTAWRQGDEAKNAAPMFHIQAGKDYSRQYRPNGDAIDDTVTQTSIDGVTEQSIAKPLYELDGTFQIYVQHYLYAEVMMDLKRPSERQIVMQDVSIELANDEQTDGMVQAGNLAPVSPTKQIETFLKSYRIDQKRRMRSGETHYLDHPLMGMIIQVRKVEEQ
ncbi:MAG: peptidoglycan binding protein CsiV [Vibrio sp.]|uniref:peptidoglycan binding protein CsiV n=1 Tax=Vibrio sp. TaxID=678 RepID=UPI003A83A872